MSSEPLVIFKRRKRVFLLILWWVWHSAFRFKGGRETAKPVFFWGISCCEEKQAKVLIVGRNIPEYIWWLGRKWALAGAQARWLPAAVQEQPRRCSQTQIGFPRWIRFKIIFLAFTYLRRYSGVGWLSSAGNGGYEENSLGGLYGPQKVFYLV